MTQSDSPDFEFDISDLEVESLDGSTSNDGESMPSGQASSAKSDVPQAAEGESVKESKPVGGDDDDAELDVFAIDDLPAPFSADPAQAEVGEVDSVEIEPEPAPVSRLEKKAEVKPSRELGADDLGADVFAEIESGSDVFSFDDVIDDLMEEVDEFEAGGFVEIDAQESSAAGDSGADGIFKMDDPDDSLSRSVDPNFVEEVDEEEMEVAPAFPSPPVDFEIPADPEPEDEVESEVEDVVEEPETVAEEMPVAEKPAPAPARSAPAPQAPRVANPPRVSNPTASTSATAAAPAPTPKPAPDFSNFEIPADPKADAEENGQVAPEAEVAREDEVAEVAPEISEEELVAESSPPVVEESAPKETPSRERVFFDAKDEEAKTAAAEASEEVLEDAIDEEVVPEVEESIEQIAEEPAEEAAASEVELGEDPVEAAEATPGEAVEESLPLDEVLDEGEDLEDLLAGFSVEESEDLPEPEADEAAEGTEVNSDLGADAEEEVVPESAAESVVPGLVEVEEELEDEAFSDLESALSEIAVEEEAVEDAEEEIATEDSPEAVIEEDSEAVEVEEPVVAEVPGLTEVPEDLDAEDISSLISSMSGAASSGPAAAPGLAVIEDDEDEEIAVLENAIPGLVEVEDEESEEVVEVPVAKAAAYPSAEELLMKAGSVLNGLTEKPEESANALLDGLEEDDDEEIVALPTPMSMMQSAVIEDDDDEVVAMPDPASMMSKAAEGLAVIDDDEEFVVEEEEEEVEVIPVSGNVADRAGDLPPPPPAPIEIIDDEQPDEDFEPAAPVVESEAKTDAVVEDGDISDPFSSDISLDDFDEGFGELDVLGEGGEAEELEGAELDGSESESDEDAPAKAAAPVVMEMPKPSLIWRITHSMSIAAGLVLIGSAALFAVWKQQIIEYVEGRDIDGSTLVHEIETIGMHALSEFDENGLYRMQWVDSEVRHVSTNEIRLHALVGAQLREDLFKPVLESELEGKLDLDDHRLLEALGVAHNEFPMEVANFPEKPWNRLYQRSAAKDEVLPLRVTYALTRESEEADWELSRIKVSGFKGDLVWPEGDPKYTFGENSYDVESEEFAEVVANYKENSESYVARVDGLRKEVEDGQMALQRENGRQRERVRMALAEGSFFSGVAIIGEDAQASRDIQLVITEVRDEGAFVKGVVRLGSDAKEQSKHFVGSLNFEPTLSGKEQGFLSMTTVSLDAPGELASDAPFFDANNISRMRLRADGFRLEGDSRDLSFRLTRNL